MSRKIMLLTLVLTIPQIADTQLIRPAQVYEGIIKGIHDYFNSTCIILLHATDNPIETQGLKEGIALHKLQSYLSRLHIRTTTLDFRTFVARVGSNYFHIKRPLFVLLNDSEDVKRDFAEIATWIDMSYPTWLIFFRDDMTISQFFEEIYIPFDCEFMIAQAHENDSLEIITEIYQVDRDKELRHAQFGTWDPRQGLITPRLGFYQRRDNLYGQIIRVTSIHDPPGALIIRDEYGKMIGLGGFFGGMMQLLEEKTNCTIKYSESTRWGHYTENGTWTGTIGMLMDKKADVVAAGLMMTLDRLEAVGFTTPLYTTGCRTYIKRPLSSALKWGAYITPFTSGIWSSIGILIVITSAIISFVKTFAPIISADKVDSQIMSMRFSDVIFAVFGAFCSQGMDQSLLDPIRLIHLVIHLTSVVILAAYSAALISSLATKTFVMPFTTMEGLLRDGTYRFGVIGDSADWSFFQNTSDQVLQVLFDDVLTKELELPNNYFDGLQTVCEEENYAFMTLDNVVSQLQPKVKCKLEPLDTIMQSSMAMAVPYRSPYKGIINSNILLIRDSGLLQRLLNSEWMLTANKRESGWETVEIGDVLPLMIVVLVGIFFSLLTLASEHLAYRRREFLIAKDFMQKSNNQVVLNLKTHNGVPINFGKL